MPFEHLQESPAERVAHELQEQGRELQNHKAGFSGMLMTHNIQVTLTAMALGMSWGVGTLVLLLYNGVVLGAVAIDYILAGQTPFLFGWLLPHGAVEIPAILVTSLASPEAMQRGQVVGAQGYMIKSEFDQSQLLALIRRLAV